MKMVGILYSLPTRKKMTSTNLSGFSKPLPLLIPKEKGLQLNEETAEILMKITQPVVVVAIAGKYRTGKSYILNLLSDLPRGAGFALGDTVESHTKGIWVYALPHPKKQDTTLVLLDTEGLGDVRRGDLTYDTTLLILTILLSSTFVLNIVGRLDEDVITQLGFVSTLTKSMKIKDSDVETGEDFALFFPQLVVLVRDFCLELIVNGKEISATEYFNDYCLEIKAKAEKFNEPRILIRKYFPRRSCETLPMPVASAKLLRQLENIPEEQMNPEFLEGSSRFVKNILKYSDPKVLTEKVRVNGSILITLLRNYLEQIEGGAVPCIETTLQSTARLENEKLLNEFITIYKEKIREALNLPTSLQVITENHQAICEQLTESFRKRVIFDGEKDEMERTYSRELNNAFNEILTANDDASRKECESRLKHLSATLLKNLEEKVYYVPGGYKAYSQELHDVIEAYNNVVDKGVKHEEVLSNFISDRNRDGNQIATLDEQMTDSERKTEAAVREKEHAEQVAKMQKEHAEQARKAHEEMKKTLERELNNAFNEILTANDDASRKECESRLKHLSATLLKNLEEKVYYVPGGYKAYSQELHDVIEAYNNVVDKGVKHEEVLSNFISDRNRDGNQIATLDEQMTDSERKTEAAVREKEHAEQVAKMQKEHAEQARKAHEEMKKTLERELNNAFNEILTANDDASRKECESRLKHLSATLLKNLEEKVYYVPGGYKAYSQELHDVIEAYNNVVDKGVKHEEVLSNFISDRNRDGNQIATLDEQMTDSERKTEAAVREKEHAEQVAKMQKEHAEQARKAHEEMKKTLEQTQAEMRREMGERNANFEKLIAAMNRPQPPIIVQPPCTIS